MDDSSDPLESLLAELRRRSFHAVGDPAPASIEVPPNSPALVARVEAMIEEFGWQHLRVAK